MEGDTKYTECISEAVDAPSPFDLLEPPTSGGFLKLSKPCCYIFPGGRGDSALFAVNGFNILIDGGSNRRSCFWKLVRHLDRIDCVLLTHIGADNLPGINGLLQRKVAEQDEEQSQDSMTYSDRTKNLISPELGVVFFNVPEKLHTSECNLKVKRSIEEASLTLQYLSKLGIKPEPLFRVVSNIIEPITLFHKLGVGRLDMFVLHPVQDSKEMQFLMQTWAGSSKAKTGIVLANGEEAEVSVPYLTSITALLVWLPASPTENIIRVLFPGNAPQDKIFEGLEKLKHLDFLRHPVATQRTITSDLPPSAVKQTKIKQRNDSKEILKSSPKTHTVTKPSKKETVENKNVSIVKTKSDSVKDNKIKEKKQNKPLRPKAEVTEKKKFMKEKSLKKHQKERVSKMEEKKDKEKRDIKKEKNEVKKDDGVKKDEKRVKAKDPSKAQLRKILKPDLKPFTPEVRKTLKAKTQSKPKTIKSKPTPAKCAEAVVEPAAEENAERLITAETEKEEDCVIKTASTTTDQKLTEKMVMPSAEITQTVPLEEVKESQVSELKKFDDESSAIEDEDEEELEIQTVKKTEEEDMGIGDEEDEEAAKEYKDLKGVDRKHEVEEMEKQKLRKENTSTLGSGDLEAKANQKAERKSLAESSKQMFGTSVLSCEEKVELKDEHREDIKQQSSLQDTLPSADTALKFHLDYKEKIMGEISQETSVTVDRKDTPLSDSKALCITLCSADSQAAFVNDKHESLLSSTSDSTCNENRTQITQIEVSKDKNLFDSDPFCCSRYSPPEKNPARVLLEEANCVITASSSGRSMKVDVPLLESTRKTDSLTSKTLGLSGEAEEGLVRRQKIFAEKEDDYGDEEKEDASDLDISAREISESQAASDITKSKPPDIKPKTTELEDTAGSGAVGTTGKFGPSSIEETTTQTTECSLVLGDHDVCSKDGEQSRKPDTSSVQSDVAHSHDDKHELEPQTISDMKPEGSESLISAQAAMFDASYSSSSSISYSSSTSASYSTGQHYGERPDTPLTFPSTHLKSDGDSEFSSLKEEESPMMDLPYLSSGEHLKEYMEVSDRNVLATGETVSCLARFSPLSPLEECKSFSQGQTSSAEEKSEMSSITSDKEHLSDPKHGPTTAPHSSTEIFKDVRDEKLKQEEKAALSSKKCEDILEDSKKEESGYREDVCEGMEEEKEKVITAEGNLDSGESVEYLPVDSSYDPPPITMKDPLPHPPHPDVCMVDPEALLGGQIHTERPAKDLKTNRSFRKTLAQSNAGSDQNSSIGTSPGQPIYVDLAYIPNPCSANNVDQEFFRSVRAAYYALSGDHPTAGANPSPAVLEALLEGKAQWGTNLQVTLIPTRDTEDWCQQTRQKQQDLNIMVLTSSSAAVMQEESFPACKIEF